jgi:hypothetical protein
VLGRLESSRGRGAFGPSRPTRSFFDLAHEEALGASIVRLHLWSVFFEPRRYLGLAELADLAISNICCGQSRTRASLIPDREIPKCRTGGRILSLRREHPGLNSSNVFSRFSPSATLRHSSPLYPLVRIYRKTTEEFRDVALILRASCSFSPWVRRMDLPPLHCSPLYPTVRNYRQNNDKCDEGCCS